MPLVTPIRYNELSSLETAGTRSQHINHLIEGPLRDIFIKYGVQNAFTLYLQRRHHQVHGNEAIVKVHGTAHLMSAEEIEDIAAVGNKIVPTTWIGSDLLHMEFAVALTFASSPPPPLALTVLAITPVVSQDFIAELTNVLSLNGCEGLFGIDTLAYNDWTELAIGKASVVVPRDGSERGEAYIPVAFAFDDKKSGFRVHGRCGKDHKPTPKP